MSVYVYFGNVSVNQWQGDMGVQLSKEDLEWLNEHRQENAQVVAKDKFHIFSEPRQMHVGSDIVEELVDRLSKYDYSNAKRPCAVIEVAK
jgi:hypothetical protein